ncbi:hypothetical protein M513_07790 [Trichuris suis]|uniref:Uncharacterized protein n=1 Tax=Trichuris suis TaxID=68888 RepID=A0A085M2D9_9BILA|nr:hypothetical protein M513_07790 [Trichuris suis]
MRSKERRKKKGSGNGKHNGITPNTGKLKGREKKQNTLLSAAVNRPRLIGCGQSSCTRKDNGITPNIGRLKGREKKQNTLLSAAVNRPRGQPRPIGCGQSAAVNRPHGQSSVTEQEAKVGSVD